MIRLFIGCSANGEDAEAQAMLDYTLHKHHRGEEMIAMEWMMLSRDPASPWYSNPSKNEGWLTPNWATPFSLFRWAIPYACNFQGRAIYMDVDMILMADIADLWNQPIPDGKCMLAKDEQHSCVILWDCERAKKHLPSVDMMRRRIVAASQIRKNLSPYMAKFSGNWNCLDGENYQSLTDPDIKVLHFTKVETQPHLKWALPRLKAKGKQHWNRMPQGLPHKRPDVHRVVDALWQEAQDAGYTADRYEALASNFGSYDAVRGGARAA